MACSSLTFASVASEIGLEESDLDALQEACSTEDFGDGDFLERIWPLIVSLAAQNDNKTDSEPARLPRGKAGCVHVPRCTVAAILARAFMGKHGVAFNFVPLFAVPADDARRPVAVAKIRCVLAYFKAIYVDGGEASRLLEGAVTFTRVHEAVAPGEFWTQAHDVRVAQAQLWDGRMEDDDDDDVEEEMALVDFANRDLLRGDAEASATQEEVLFSTRPELFAAVMIIERLEAEDAVLFEGCRRFSNYTGYGASFRYAPLPHSADMIVRDAPPIVAMDAHVNTGGSQFAPHAALADLHKAHIAFRAAAKLCTRISTGLWGCGAFGGDACFKLCQQLMAAAVAGVGLRFSARGRARHAIERVNAFANGRTVAELAACVLVLNSSGGSDVDEMRVQLLRPGGFQALAEHRLGGMPAPPPSSAEEREARVLIAEAAAAELAGDADRAVHRYRRALKLFPDLAAEL